MNGAPDCIPDIENEINAKARVMPVLLWAITGYIVILIANLIWEFGIRGGGRISAGSATGLSIVVIVPLAGLILLWFRKKAGWIIALLYFGFMAIQLSVYLAKKIYSRRYFSFNNYADLFSVVALALSVLVIILLVSADTRKRLALSKKVFLATLCVITIIDVMLVALLLK